MTVVFLGLVLVLVILLAPVVFQYLWNSTMPQVFGLRTIEYWQAFRLLLLASMLFGAGGFLHFNFNN